MGLTINQADAMFIFIFSTTICGYNQSQTDVIYMEKAFERINHKLLIKKLKMYGFIEPLLLWFYSFISGHTQLSIKIITLAK